MSQIDRLRFTFAIGLADFRQFLVFGKILGGCVNAGARGNDVISRNIRQYEELLNSRELMEERALFPCDRSETAVFSASIQWYESSSPTQLGLTLTTDEFWELYDTCIVPDLRDGNIGGVKIIQDEDFYRTIEPIYITATGVHTNSNGEYVYNYYTVRPLAVSARTSSATCGTVGVRMRSFVPRACSISTVSRNG